MDWENMSKAKKQLIVAMMLGDAFRENMGVLIKKETKIMLDDKEFHYEGPEIRVKEGNIVEFGATEEDRSPYEILEAKNDTVVLKKVMFFKARATTSYHSMNEFCVCAADRSEAFKVLKEYMKDRDYTRIISMNPSKFFEPLIK